MSLITPNGKQIDNYYNRYSADDHYTEVLVRDGYVAQASEINELQSIINARLQGIGDALFSDGDVIKDGQISVSDSGVVTAEAGLVYISGMVRSVPAATFTIATSGTVTVGVRLAETIISEAEDAGLLNPAVGSRGQGEPGAWRRKAVSSWGYDGDGGSGSFYPIYTIDDGVLRAKETPPNLDSFMKSIAKYDVDSTGGGSYIAKGMFVHQADDDAQGRQVYTIDEGTCRVNGYGFDFQTSRRVTYDAEPDLRTIDSEVIVADGSGSQRVTVAHPPLRGITSLRVTLQKTVTVTHGSYTGCADTLPDTSVRSIVSVVMGDTTYAAGTDYQKTGDTVDWSPSGAEPSVGSTYTVTYTYISSSVTPSDVDYDGFTAAGAVEGSDILITYTQGLPRKDRLCVTSDGTFSWVQGVPAEYNAKAPAVPSGMLAIATVTQTWREASARGLSNDGVRVVSFAMIENLSAKIDYAINEIARQRLESDVSTREAGAKVGLFVDPLLDDSMRDQGIEQTAAVVNGYLMLPIEADDYTMSGDISSPACRQSSPTILLEQPLRTGEIKVNPYQAFTPMPMKATLTPAVDRWTVQKSSWASPVTQTFFRTVYAPTHPLHGSTVTTSSSTTENLGTAKSDVLYLRQIPVSFSLSGFGSGERLKSLTFDGVEVTPSGGMPTAGTDGAMTGTFTIPDGIPAGVKSVVFTGAGGSLAQSTFVGQGTLETTTLRTVQSVVNTLIDPVAQTFTLTADSQISGVDLFFTAKGTTGVHVQIRETSGGYPTRVVLAESIIAADALTVGKFQRILFDAPVALTGGVEYALVVLCDDADTALGVAELGSFDSSAQQWVTAQPYTVGVLLSSSNASTWTAHQTRDLTFRLLAPTYAVSDMTVDLGATAIMTGATDLILKACAETPSAASRVDYVVTLPTGDEMTIAADQPVELSTAMTGAVSVKAKLSGDEASSSLLWPGTQLIAGTVARTGTYYTRTIPATGATSLTLVYDAYIPSGATVTPEYQVDGGDWTAMTAKGTTQEGDGNVEYSWHVAISDVDTAKVRLTLTGTTAARPMVYGIRMMATV